MTWTMHGTLADRTAHDLAELTRTAWHFAAHAHREQRVPGTQLPYLLHLAQVSSELAPALRASQQHRAVLATCAAILHDCVEDCGVTPQDLTEVFGPEITAGVQALTKDSSLPKPQRLPDSLTRIAAQPAEVWMVKLADRITNLGKPPDSWSLEKRAAYRREAQVILEGLGSSSEWLASRLRQCIVDYQQFCS
jgi:GTP diphosphokinase / guanosine-3',5'-bis(diphosphate) 3'-diphosphatase